MNKTVSALLPLAMVFTFTGCMNGSPKPSSGSEQAMVFIKSNTAEKFKNISKETAIWNGLSPFFVKDKQYQRCDLLEESILAFTNSDFTIVTSKDKADYTVDLTLLSCGTDLGGYYAQNRTEFQMKDKNIYKDLLHWIDSQDDLSIKKEAQEIADGLLKNDLKAYNKFYKENYSKKISTFLNKRWWKIWDRSSKQYIESTKGVVYPNKYAKMTKEDLEILKNYEFLIRQNNKTFSSNNAGGSLITVGQLGLHSNLGSFQSAGALLGGAGILVSAFSAKSPDAVNEFTITNNTNNKSISLIHQHKGEKGRFKNRFETCYGSIQDDIIDEIDWNEIN